MQVGRTHFGAFAAIIAATAIATTSAAGVANAQSVNIPAEVAAKGIGYYVVPGKPGANIDQTRFTNRPPKSKKKIDSFTGFTNSITGYAVVDSSGEPANLVAGEFHLPVKSLDTGVKGRNKHLTQRLWLNAKKFPVILFKIKSTRNITLTGDNTYKAELVGDITMHGVTKEMVLPVEIAALTAGDKGDLLRIRANYAVTLSDFGVKNGIIGKKVAKNIMLEQYIVLSTKKAS